MVDTPRPPFPPPNPEKPGVKPAPAQDDDGLRPLRTFESDAAMLLTKEAPSVKDIVIAEKTKTPEQKAETLLPVEPPAHPDRRNLIIIISSIVLGAGLLIGAGYYLLQPTPPPTAPITTEGGKPIVSVDSETAINATGKNRTALISEIVRARGSAIPVNTVRLLRLQKTVEGVDNTSSVSMQTQELLTLLSPTVPGSLLRALDQTHAIGVFGYDGNQLFLMLKNYSYETSYGSMLSWEGDMAIDLSPLFLTKDLATLLGTTTEALAKQGYFGTDPRNQLWSDLTVKNLDTRVIKDTNGKVVMLYAFADPSTILITTDDKTFGALIDKLKRSKLIK